MWRTTFFCLLNQYHYRQQSSRAGRLAPPSCCRRRYRWVSSRSREIEEVEEERVECVVVGAGVVGLAVARALAMRGREVVVLEAASTIGTATSSRNSEVIHAGLYYPNSSSKALLCVRGRHALYSYCYHHNVPFQQIGKLVVATHQRHIPTLHSLHSRGLQNGVSDLRFLTKQEASKLEPNVQCVSALFSPSTGIVDSHAFMVSLQADAEEHGATFSFNSVVTHGKIVAEGGIQLCVSDTEALRSNNGQTHPCDDDDDVSMVLRAKILVNAAGLNAIALARSLEGFPAHALPPSFFARGCYFSLSGSSEGPPFSHLIYPVPEDGGLGVHVTLDLAGHVRFGPDVEWLDMAGAASENHKPCKLEFDYTVDPRRAERFYPEIRKYYPSLQDGTLNADYAGIRPKISGPGDLPADFLIQCQDVHHVPGLVNLFGIESPGLTASLAIADEVAIATQNT